MDDPKLSRRGVLALSGVAALQAACSTGIPAPVCCVGQPPQLFPPARPGPVSPLPGFTAERLRVWAFDEMHGIDADVHRPREVEELQSMIKAASASRRRVTVRGGGRSLGQQALGETIILIDAPAFRSIGPVRRQDNEFQVTCGAGARWGDVVQTLGAQGYVPRSVVTSGDATVGGTGVVDGVSRMSPITGKEGQQIVSITMIDGRGSKVTLSDPQQPEMRAAITGFGLLGVVTEVTFRVARAIHGVHRRPSVETVGSRFMPGTYDWDDLLLSIASDSRAASERYDELLKRSPDVPLPASVPNPVIGLSIVAWFSGEGLAIDRLEHRYVINEGGPRIPGGLYEVGSGFARFGEWMAGYSDTLTQLITTSGFPDGRYVDDLCGFFFFMGNSATPAVECTRKFGARLNFTQQTFLIPTPVGPGATWDVRGVRRFFDLVVSRCRERGLRPFSVDLLHLEADDGLLSATRDLAGFAVTITFADHDAAQWPWIQETFVALSRDTLDLGGRVHLVKNVEAERGDLRLMYAGGFRQFKAIKARFDPQGIFTSEFYERYFAGWSIA